MSDENLKKIKELPREILEELVIEMYDELNKGSEISIEQERLKSELEYYKNLTQRLYKKGVVLKKKLELLSETFVNISTIWNKTADILNGELDCEIQNEKSPEKIQHDKDLASPQWKRKREKVFERYGRQCVICGKTHNLQIHHLVYRKGRHAWEYDVDELIPLCKKCHNEVHKDKNHKFHEKYLC